MKDDLINNGPEATEKKQISFEALFFIITAILLLFNIVFASLYIHSIGKEKQYEIKLNEKDSLNASLQSMNNLLNNQLK